MPNTLQTAIASNSAFSPSYLPVAVFAGGTSGIGQGMAEAFARHTKGNAHIILVGRNRASAEKIISEFPKPTAEGVKHEFVACDAVLMKNIEPATKGLLERLPWINFLVLSTGTLAKVGRDDTIEGIDRKLSLAFYARMKFISDLLPLLRKAAEMGQAATVHSVLLAGMGQEIEWDNLGLKKSDDMFKFRGQCVTYTDVAFQEFAAQNPMISFIHAMPGVVRTPLIDSTESFLFWMIFKVVHLLRYSSSLSYSDSGEYQLFGMLNVGKKPGSWGIFLDGMLLAKQADIATEEERRRLWDHTFEEIARAQRTG